MDSPTVMTKVYPTADELVAVNTNLNCPECNSVFHSESNLNLHLAKTHKRPEVMPAKKDKIYYCPIKTCVYNTTSHFKAYKYIKQHYLKVHAEKQYFCDFCNTGFPTEAFKKSHMEYCNIHFKCCDCDMKYPSYETLKTHSRRKKHRILEKLAYKVPTPIKTPQSDLTLWTRKNCYILPKMGSSSNVEISATSEQSSQTDNANNKQNIHQETQTFPMKLPQLTVETQTIGHYFVKKSNDNGVNNNNKSANTQTPFTDPKSVSCNTSFKLEDDNELVNEIERNNSSTQTNIPHCFDHKATIHTDTSDLLSADTLDTNFFNMETQTDLMFNDELLKYCDDYSNMYTQTCEDLFLGEIGLNNTHTQTVFDDVLRSVESQTTMSQWRKLPLSCKDMSHMETQTEFEFKQMLEEINA